MTESIRLEVPTCNFPVQFSSRHPLTSRLHRVRRPHPSQVFGETWRCLAPEEVDLFRPTIGRLTDAFAPGLDLTSWGGVPYVVSLRVAIHCASTGFVARGVNLFVR